MMLTLRPLVFLLPLIVTGKHHGCVWNPLKLLNEHEHLKVLQVQEELRTEVLPEAWDWRNVNGTNYVTRTLNQHIPKYCGSCWVHAAVSSFSDRLKIARNAEWPEVQLSTQYALNCLTKAGTCDGGSDLLLYIELAKDGSPDDTCESYVAEDQKCNQRNRCRNCFGPPGHGKCFPQSTYVKYKAKDYGYFKNEDIPDAGPDTDFHRKQSHHNKSSTEAITTQASSSTPSPHLKRMILQMKDEIYQRGPISCVVDAEPMFKYQAGEILDAPGKEINHVISIAGWGIENGTEYWIGRNSWGTYWGDNGWMKIKMGSNSVFVESFCSFVMPDWPPVEVNEPISEEFEDLMMCNEPCSKGEGCPKCSATEEAVTAVSA